jgi:hypothetical protein
MQHINKKNADIMNFASPTLTTCLPANVYVSIQAKYSFHLRFAV